MRWLKLTGMMVVAALVTLFITVPALASPASDWKGRPVQYWTTDKFTYHSIGFDTDAQNKNVLLYVDMNPDTVPDHEGHQGGYSVLQPSGYTIKANGHTYSIDLQKVYEHQYNNEKGKSYSIGVGVYDQQTGTYKTYKNVGQMYIDSEGHQSCLVKIPYESFGSSFNGSSKMTLTNNNLGGSSEITVSGVSTGPYLLAIIGALILSLIHI